MNRCEQTVFVEPENPRELGVVVQVQCCGHEKHWWRTHEAVHPKSGRVIDWESAS